MKLDRNYYEAKLLKEKQFIKINKLNLNLEKKKNIQILILILMLI